MKEEEIIQLLASGKIEKAFVKLYKVFPKVKSVLKKYGAKNHQCNDIFQDALVVLYQKLQLGNFTIQTSIESYLMNTCKYMYLKSTRSVIGMDQLNEQVVDETDAEHILVENEKIQQAETAFDKIGEKCKEILISFYIHQKSMTDIARQFSFSSENVAKTQKYKCLEAARKNYQQLMNS